LDSGVSISNFIIKGFGKKPGSLQIFNAILHSLSTLSGSLAWRRLYGEQTVRKPERVWFLSEGEESEALGINGPGPIYSGAKATCFRTIQPEPYKENSNFQSIIPKDKGLCIIGV